MKNLHHELGAHIFAIESETEHLPPRTPKQTNTTAYRDKVVNRKGTERDESSRRDRDWDLWKPDKATPVRLRPFSLYPLRGEKIKGEGLSGDFPRNE